jgi:hypothetical protein
MISDWQPWSEDWPTVIDTAVRAGQVGSAVMLDWWAWSDD